MNSIKTELDQPISFCIQKSEVYQYWEVILNKIRFLKNLIAADSRGDWHAHL